MRLYWSQCRALRRFVNLIIHKGEKVEDPGKNPQSQERTNKNLNSVSYGPGLEINPGTLVGGRHSHHSAICAA